MKLHEAFSPEESEKIYTNFLAIINDPKRRDKLVRKHGANAENVAYGTAVNQVKKQAATEKPPVEEPTTEEPMDKEQKLKEMVRAALSKPLSEKKGKDRDGDRDIDQQDYLIARDVAIKKAKGKVDEDLDLGHTDNEPHMIKGDLYEIGTYAMELYKMVDQFENGQEVDFPAWWQSKITTARNMISSAKHYLEFELNEPKIDTILRDRENNLNEGDVVTADQIKALKDKFEKYVKTLSDDIESLKKGPSPQIAVRYKMLKDKLGENTLEEKFASKFQQKYLYATNPEAAEKLASKMTKKDYKSLPDKIKEAVLAKLKQK